MIIRKKIYDLISKKWMWITEDTDAEIIELSDEQKIALGLYKGMKQKSFSELTNEEKNYLMMKIKKFFDYLTMSWVEEPDDSEFTNIEEVEIGASEYMKKNFGPNVKVRTFSELTKEEKENYMKENKNDNSTTEII